MAVHHSYSRLYPKTVFISEKILYVRHADPIYAIQVGFQEEYLLSECVWYQGYIDYPVLTSYGLCLLPIYFKPGIIIFHVPTSMYIECGFTPESFNQWCVVLENANLCGGRKISRFTPLVTLFFAAIGLFLSFTLLCLTGNLLPSHIEMLLASFFSIFFVILGNHICGHDYFKLKYKNYCIGVFLLFLLIGIFYILKRLE
jgi:hypothetical protein